MAPADTDKRSRPNTRARLLEAATEVFADHGFQAVSINDLCAAAGFTRGAFYSNFDTKEELFLALWDERADQIIATIALLRDAIEQASVPLETALDLLADHELYDRRWFVLNTEFLLHAMRDDDAAALLSHHRERLRAELEALIGALMDGEGLAPPAGIELDELTRLVIAGHEGCQNQTRVEGDRPARALFRTYLELVLTACRAG